MNSAIRSQIHAEIAKLVTTYNPYVSQSVRYFIDGSPRYIFHGESLSRTELDSRYTDTAEKDAMYGYNDRINGYYDKWYRYSHSDEGTAYDIGVKIATSQNRCPEEFYIIPCIH